MIRMRQKDIILESDFRSFIEHCLFINDQYFDKCSKVLSMGLELLIDQKSHQHQLIVETCIPLIFSLALNKIPEEALELISFQNTEEGEKAKSKYFDVLKNDDIPLYHDQSHVVYLKEFDQTYRKEVGKKNIGDNASNGPATKGMTPKRE